MEPSTCCGFFTRLFADGTVQTSDMQKSSGTGDYDGGGGVSFFWGRKRRTIVCIKHTLDF